MSQVHRGKVEKMKQRARRDYGDEITTEIEEHEDGWWFASVTHECYGYSPDGELRKWKDLWRTWNGRDIVRVVKVRLDGTWFRVDLVEVDINYLSREDV